MIIKLDLDLDRINLILVMKITNIIIQRFTKSSSNSTSNAQGISLPEIIQHFSDHFKQHCSHYELPLLQPQGTLSYTSRFMKTAINVPAITQDHKKILFKSIKKSILRHNLTPKSCVDIC